MTSRERIRAALTFRQPDAVPVDFGSTAVTGMHVNIIAALREFYGLEPRKVKAYEPYQMLGNIEEDLLHVLGVDTIGVAPRNTLFGFANENWRSWRMPNGLEILVSEHFVTSRDRDGGYLIHPEGDKDAPPSGKMPSDGYFFDTLVRQDPIDESTLDPEDNLQEFAAITERELDYFDENVARAAESGRAVVANFGGTGFGDIALVAAPFLKHPRGIRDIEEWYISTVTRQDYIHRVFDRQCEIALHNLARIHQRVSDRVDVLYVCGTDFGTQTSTFCSVETFRSLYMPYYKRINDWVHRNTSWKTFKHSCGAVRPLIPSLIESGFDILNPVQLTAQGMEPHELKESFGRDLVFWGGGVDTQTVLAFDEPEQVKAQVLDRCEILNRDGGFVFNAVHNVQGNTPVRNVVAMIEAIHEYRER